MTEPYDVVQELERDPRLPRGLEERFHGYGVMSCPFDSGDILCHRRFAATSVGVPYTSIWHRDRGGEWHFYQDTAPENACPRYFGSALVSATTTPITAEWQGRRTLHLSAADLDWTVTLEPTPVTRTLNGIGRVMPDSLWTNERVLRVLSTVAGRVMGAGRLSLSGMTPNRQHFMANPRLIWMIREARATIDGRDLGGLAVSDEQTALGDFWIPRKGLFGIGQAYFEPFDPNRHLPAQPPTNSQP